MGLDYGHTCPIIDRELGSIKESVRNELSDLLDGTELTAEEIKPLLDDYTDYIMRHLNDCFEDVRSCNEDMRKEADYQIDDLKTEVYDLEENISELKEEVERLERNTPIGEYM